MELKAIPVKNSSMIPVGLRMDQPIAWRSTGFSVAHYRDVGARWLAKYRGFNFLWRFRLFFSNARDKTNDNFSVVGDAFYIPYFFSAQHFDTRPSNKRDEDINPTHRGRQPYTADTGIFKFNIY